MKRKMTPKSTPKTTDADMLKASADLLAEMREGGSIEDERKEPERWKAHQARYTKLWNRCSRLATWHEAQSFAALVAKLDHTACSVSYGHADWHGSALIQAVNDLKRLAGLDAKENPDAELLALWAEVRADKQAIDTPADRSDEEIERLVAALNEKEERLAEMVPQTIGGVIALLDFLHHNETTICNGDTFNNSDSDTAFNSVKEGLARMSAKGRAA